MIRPKNLYETDSESVWDFFGTIFSETKFFVQNQIFSRPAVTRWKKIMQIPQNGTRRRPKQTCKFWLDRTSKWAILLDRVHHWRSILSCSTSHYQRIGTLCYNNTRSLFFGIIPHTCIIFGEYFKVLKASPPLQELKQLKFDKAHILRILKHQLLDRWWPLFSAVFQICFQERLPGTVSTVGRTQQPKLLSWPVSVLSIVDVFQADPFSFLNASKIKCKALSRPCFLIWSQPDVIHRFPGFCNFPNCSFNSQFEYAAGRKHSTGACACQRIIATIAGAFHHNRTLSTFVTWEFFDVICSETLKALLFGKKSQIWVGGVVSNQTQACHMYHMCVWMLSY